MGVGLDPDTSIAVICAVGVALAFGLVMLALESSTERRYRRRLNSVYDRAHGNASPAPAAVRSLSREQSATKLDRIARDWLPRREILAARLARTGRTSGLGRSRMAAPVLGGGSA